MAPTVEERRLRMLHSKKEQMFRSFQRLYDLCGDLSNAQSRVKFLGLVGSLDKVRSDFVNVLDEIVMLEMEVDEKYIPNHDVLDTVDEMCAEIRRAERTLGGEETERRPRAEYEAAAAAARGSFRLPKLELPHFSGDIREWETFYDLFLSLVHENPNLSDMDKLYYLMGSLKGPARNVCAGISLSGDNYEVVWDALVERYHDTRALAKAYFNQMLEWRDSREESEKGLISFLEKYEASWRALRKLKLRDLTDFMCLHHALERLNPVTANYFELSRHSGSVPQYDELLEFIKLRVKTLGTSKVKDSLKSKESEPSKVKFPSRSFVVNKPGGSGSGTRCEYCRKSDHRLGACSAFVNLSPENRYLKIKSLNLCYNCFAADHGVRSCPSPSKCDNCNYKHHTLIHREPAVMKPAKISPERKIDEGVSLYSSGLSGAAASGTTVLLGTAEVEIQSPLGCCKGRFLIDSGSQLNLISRRFGRRLGLSIAKCSSSVQGLGGFSQAVRGVANFTVVTKDRNSTPFSVTALVVEKITGLLPQSPVQLKNDVWLREVPLADRNFDRPGPIEGLLGAEIFASIVGSNHIKGEGKGLVAMETSLGYIVMGRIAASRTPGTQQAFLSRYEAPRVEDLVRQFWEMETVPKIERNSPEDDECEKIFRKDFFRDFTGRFTVSLPFKFTPSQLGDSRAMARRRYFSLEARLRKNLDLMEGYRRAMEDFIDQGHIYPVKEDFSDAPSYYIPHHAVYKEESESTPVRIVLDASALSDSGKSLNSILYVGPKLQADICSILIRFRLFPVAVVADIKQMYRQIEIIPHHRRFQRLLWRWSPEDPLETWEMGTLAFGVASSPFLALRCVKELLQQEGHAYPRTTEIVEESLYMDDLVASVPTLEDAERLFYESVELFRKGKFDLTKWVSNSQELLDEIPLDRRCKGKTLVEFEGATNILGLTWEPREDRILIKFPSPSAECTKRSMLSSVARCFDPIGLSAPLTLLLKVLVKELWLLKLDWDEKAPWSIQQRWKRIQEEWSELEKFEIKRSGGATAGTSMKLFGFADASKDGYGGVVYGQMEQSGLQFICAKSRVSPVKVMSIPRLELCAAVLLANLLAYVIEVLDRKVKIADVFGFSDSSTVLQWLKSSDLKDTFVRTRVTRVRDILPKAVWKHIPGKENPADGLSRGLSPSQLVQNKLWVEGPNWIKLPEEEWPCTEFGSAMEPLVELATCQEPPESLERHPLLRLIERKSSWSEILRITVWVLRWLKVVPKGSSISAADLRIAERMLILLVQKRHFVQDFQLLEKGKEPSSRLRRLRPFIHEGTLRVGGRLARAPIAFDHRHQFILPKEDILTERIVDYYHLKYLHTGAYLVEALLREKFWILKGRSLIKRRIRACNRCFRTNPKSMEPLMADLPGQRVNPAVAFLHTGVDYFGPINITLGRKRGASVIKAYVALFVCMAVKAIHLELVSSLSTDHFLQALKRFLSRRGSCKVLYSDRGTNFVGAKRELSELAKLIQSKEYDKIIGKELSDRQVEWKFIPAAAPHMGGIWESQVKVVKRHLFRVIGEQVLSYEELNTFLIQVEALLNSRPLCRLSSDPSAPLALTPAHFLHSAPLEDFPTEDLLEVKQNRLTRFQLLDQMVQSFWKRWKLEYLTSLQDRQKWTKRSDNIEIGTVVVLRVENSRPLQWPLAVVTAVFPGRDGVVRTVELRCGGKSLIRPVVKVCPLPTQ